MQDNATRPKTPPQERPLSWKPARFEELCRWEPKVLPYQHYGPQKEKGDAHSSWEQSKCADIENFLSVMNGFLSQIPFFTLNLLSRYDMNAFMAYRNTE